MADGEYKFEQYQGADINALLGKLATFLGQGNVSMGLQTLISELNTIKGKISAAASSNNKLADKAYVSDYVEDYVATQMEGESSERGSAITAAINALDAIVSMAMNASGLSLGLTQENGKVTGISGSISMDGTPTSGSSKPVTSAGVKSYVDEKTAAAEMTKLGTVKLYNLGGTNRSGLHIENGALLVYALSEYGLYRSGDGKLVANLRRSATSSDIAKVGTEQAVDYAAITTANLVEAVEKVSDVTGETITEADLDELFPLNS